MYEQIQRNTTASWIVIALTSLLLIGLGWVFGQMFGGGWTGVIVAAAIASVMGLVGYYGSDRIILAVSGAHLATKEDNPYLYHTVEGLSIAAGIPVPKTYIIEDSALNAFATGRDPEHASIAVTRGLLDKLNRVELEGVIAHEISHIKNYDIRLATITVIMVGTIVLLADWIKRIMWWGRGTGSRSKKRDGRSGDGGGEAILLTFGVILAILAPIFAQLLRFALSRRREFLADADGALLTRYPEGLASALEKISQDEEPLEAANRATASLYIVNPFKSAHDGSQGLFSTHPPIQKRIEALRKM
ncbi:MAG: M48 family metallopeptidase [Firmicutes bacterium]|jgi:heat shock protein HtpX|nr:M48 family metallopeptidase [Bacillota bacterium]